MTNKKMAKNGEGENAREGEQQPSVQEPKFEGPVQLIPALPKD